ncbi:MAG: GTPase ObgE [Eubacteriales bacterium]|jgi:GTP-binding protein
MFVDIAKIYVKAGDGGNGAVSFHRQKYIAAGGPDGGDGGKGGDVVFVVDDHMSTLLDFRYKRKYVAANGEPGSGKKCFGKDGKDVVIKVPRGTLIKDRESGRLLKDMSDGEPFVCCRGGRGGWGNTHFATPTRQVPRFAKPGTPGQERELTLELKLLADVGLVGFPNVGKSTLLSMVSAAQPKIANYHFTTLSPNLGVVSAAGESFVMADIPGIIEGASEGVGLGHDFLRHVDRCRLLLHVVDISGVEGRDPMEDFRIINEEMAAYSEELSSRPQIVVGNKSDIVTDPEMAQRFQKWVEEQGYDYFTISAATRSGVEELMKQVVQRLSQLPPVTVYESEPLPEIVPDNSREVTIRVEDGVYFVEGAWLLQLLGSVNFSDRESLQYFQRTLRNTGVIEKLEEAGVQEGDTVVIYDLEFDFVP